MESRTFNAGMRRREHRINHQLLASGNGQNDAEYTGVNYDLTATTGEGGAVKTMAMISTTTVKSATSGKLSCT